MRTTDVMDSSSGKVVRIPLSFPRLKDGVSPTIFQGYPVSMAKSAAESRPSPSEKRVKVDMEQLSSAIQQSIKEYEEYETKRTFSSLSELKRLLKDFLVNSSWTVIYPNDREIHFYLLSYSPAPFISKSIIIDTDLNVFAFHKTQKITKFDKFEFPLKIKHMNKLMDVLSAFAKENIQWNVDVSIAIINDMLISLKHIVTHDKKLVVDFLSEQLLLLVTKKNALHYSSDLLIFCSLLFSISPHAYRFLRDSNHVIFPHPSTIERLCSSFKLNPQIEQQSNNFLLYAKTRFELLKLDEKKVSLMVDEIHIKQYLDYKGGSIVGKSALNDNAAGSAFVFMLLGICSSFKDVVHILPAQNVDAQGLHMYIKNVIIGLEKIGYFIVCVTTDNNSINGKAMSFFANPPRLSIVYVHPYDAKRPLFYIYDPVHLLKCIRNNWLNQKNDGQCMYYLDFDDHTKTKTASFKTIKNIHSLEDGQIVKYVYELSLKALSPSSMERQNVKLCLQIFNEHVCEGLKVMASHTDDKFCAETADYISIIIKWWKIMNVKSKYKGLQKRDIYSEPLTINESDERVIYLKKFLLWVDSWKACGNTTGFLTQETYTALSHTTHAVLELLTYCCETLKMSYFLTSKIQTDALENRFGKFRQLSGSQYNISLRQVFENEAKLRLQTIAPLISSRFGKINISLEDVKSNPLELQDVDISCFENIVVDEEDFYPLVNILPLLTYIAGYCCRSVFKSNKCTNCKQMLTLDNIDDAFDILDNDENSYILNCSRGGLCYPKSEILDVIIYSYIIVQKLISDTYEKRFLECENQRLVAIKLILFSIKDKEIYNLSSLCKDHGLNVTIQKIVKCSVNTLLNNFCKKKNNEILQRKKMLKPKKSDSKKRKLQTLQ